MLGPAPHTSHLTPHTSHLTPHNSYMNPLTSLTKPHLPRNAFSIDGHEVSAVELRRRGGRFAVSGAAYEALPPGLCVPSFDGPNVPNPTALAAVMHRVTDAAGLAGRHRWSVLLPEA